MAEIIGRSEASLGAADHISVSRHRIRLRWRIGLWTWLHAQALLDRTTDGPNSAEVVEDDHRRHSPARNIRPPDRW